MTGAEIGTLALLVLGPIASALGAAARPGDPLLRAWDAVAAPFRRAESAITRRMGRRPA